MSGPKIRGAYTSLEYSDFYVRDNNKIFLFEFKNSIIKSSVKYSHSFSEIEAEIKSKLFFAENSKKDKGLRQIKKVIQSLSTKCFDFDKFDEKGTRKAEVYPIIVFTDLFFSIDGVNYIMNRIFEKELDSLRLTSLKINNLIMISLEGLIDIVSSVEERKYSFREVCDLFYKRVKANEKKGRQLKDDSAIKK